MIATAVNGELLTNRGIIKKSHLARWHTLVRGIARGGEDISDKLIIAILECYERNLCLFFISRA